MSPSERYPLFTLSAFSSTETSDDDGDTDGEELLAARAAAKYAGGAADERHSMLKHFFRGDDGPTCSCTPNSLTPPPCSATLPPCPLQVLELWPLLPQLEHFLAMAAVEEGNPNSLASGDKMFVRMFASGGASRLGLIWEEEGDVVAGEGTSDLLGSAHLCVPMKGTHWHHPFLWY